MSLTSTITAIAVPASSTIYTLDDNAENGINKQKASNVAYTALATAATTTIAGTVNYKGQQDIYRKYSQAYVESLSDEELECALQEVNLLVPENDSTEEKSI